MSQFALVEASAALIPYQPPVPIPILALVCRSAYSLILLRGCVIIVCNYLNLIIIKPTKVVIISSVYDSRESSRCQENQTWTENTLSAPPVSESSFRKSGSRDGESDVTRSVSCRITIATRRSWFYIYEQVALCAHRCDTLIRSDLVSGICSTRAPQPSPVERRVGSTECSPHFRCCNWGFCSNGCKPAA